MPRSTLKSNPPKWVLALYREMQTSIGHQFQMECKLPDELPKTCPLLWLAWTKKSSAPVEPLKGMIAGRRFQTPSAIL